MRGRKRKERKYSPGFGTFLRIMRKFMFPDDTMQEFAESIGITGPYLSHLENGSVPPPSDEVIEALAKKLEIDVDILMALAGKRDYEYEFPADLSPDLYLQISTQLSLGFPGCETVSPAKMAMYYSEVLSRTSELISNSMVPYKIIKEMVSPMNILNYALYSMNTHFRKARIEAFNEVFS